MKILPALKIVFPVAIMIGTILAHALYGLGIVAMYGKIGLICWVLPALICLIFWVFGALFLEKGHTKKIWLFTFGWNGIFYFWWGPLWVFGLLVLVGYLLIILPVARLTYMVGRRYFFS